MGYCLFAHSDWAGPLFALTQVTPSHTALPGAAALCVSLKNSMQAIEWI